MNKLESAAQMAEEATRSIKDSELRKVAFDRILAHLLAEGSTPAATNAPKVKAKATPPGKTGSVRQGPTTWLREMIVEGFFDSPQGQAEMLRELASRGHHLRDTDITKQLEALTQKKELRRNKAKSGGPKGLKEIWKYSKW